MIHRSSFTLQGSQARNVVLVAMMLGFSAVCTQGQTVPQGSTGTEVQMTWHTVAAPSYGAVFQYAWTDASISDGSGTTIPITLDPTMNEFETGFFDLTSKPIQVPASGVVVALTRTIELSPSEDERGTMLPDDPRDRCKYAADGAMRATFHQVIDVIDAVTNEILISGVDRYRIAVTRHDILENAVTSDKVAVDLAPCAGRKVMIRARVLTSYNGRGPSSRMIAAPAPIDASSHQDGFSTRDLK